MICGGDTGDRKEATPCGERGDAGPGKHGMSGAAERNGGALAHFRCPLDGKNLALILILTENKGAIGFVSQP